MRRLPPLNALRAFEAAARHASFAKAADELAVTPAAVSQQIRLLEADLGVTLFRRQARGLVVTEAATRALPELGKAFAHLQRAVEGVRGDPLAGPLVVSAIPSFAARWVVPRLGGFIAAYQAKDGKEAWRFYTIPGPGEAGNEAGTATGPGSSSASASKSQNQRDIGGSGSAKAQASRPGHKTIG